MFGKPDDGEAAFWLEIGKKIAAARKNAGLNQQELADKMGYSRASIANIETGRQRVDLWQMKKFEDELVPQRLPLVRPV